MGHQNPDDLTCRPTRFTSFDHDSVISTYAVNSPWHLPKFRLIGELIVRQSADGRVAVSLTLEEGWQK